MVDEKIILKGIFKLTKEAFGWIDENNEASYRDFYNYTSGMTDLADALIRELDEEN